MARGLELITVAEGVDSTAQMKFLREHGCDQVQGYAVSVPLTAEEFARRVLASQAQATSIGDEVAS
jgi:EAL domain-containing protein (putative c-di-GMP-specific phosphodiesterase class I)